MLTKIPCEYCKDWVRNSVLPRAKDLEYGAWGNQKSLISTFYLKEKLSIGYLRLVIADCARPFAT